ncbi:MAG: VCBS repeat-containing protein [Kiritimatiellae bacterium]|nr:VCBS repeat-containing protein [Kiritimatiellia bacterium]
MTNQPYESSLRGRGRRVSPQMLCLCLLTTVLGASAPAGAWKDQTRPPIDEVKEQYLDTIFAAGGEAKAAIAVPADGRYDAAVARIQEAVRKHGGVSLPVVRGATDPRALLRDRSVIALGNMSTNPFIEKLYCQWYCLLDLKYPGKGGYVVRSLHNPYATGRNVVFVGGSDDAGVLKGAEVFCGLLRAGDPLKLGWTMKIQLGAGLVPPDVGEDAKGLTRMGGWTRSWGWNALSAAGALYYMTGEPTYLDCFKAFARPDPKNIPKALQGGGGSLYDDPANPIVTGQEYNDHRVALVWDLIEESPGFDDEFRMFFTKQLLEHQFWRQLYGDPKDDSYVNKRPTRHTAYKMLGMYADSRYFAKYYPNPRWDTRLESVRKSFDGFIEGPAWWESLDMLGSCVQYVFAFFVLDGYEEFVASGAAQMYMNHLLMMRTGEAKDNYKASLAPVLLNQAAHITGDSRYVWLLQHDLDSDWDRFRIGRSFWPAPEREPRTPTDLTDRIMAFPPQQIGKEQIPYAVEPGSGYKMLTFRSGLSAEDDFFQMDGYFGRGRTAYHVNALYKLRMFGGRQVLSGYNNDVDVWYEGEADLKVAHGARLHTALSAPGLCYVKTAVDEMPYSAWERHLVYIKDEGCAFLDVVTPQRDGPYAVRCSWSLSGDPSADRSAGPNAVHLGDGVFLACGTELDFRAGGNSVMQTLDTNLRKDQPASIGNCIFREQAKRKPAHFVWGVGDRAYVKKGARPAFFAAAGLPGGGVTLAGDFVYLDSDRLILAGATAFALNGLSVLEADKPVSLIWELASGRLALTAVHGAAVRLAGNGRAVPATIEPGAHTFESVSPSAALRAGVEPALQRLAALAPEQPRFAERQAAAVQPDWQPRWKATLAGPVTHLDTALDSQIWAACRNGEGTKLHRVGVDGTVAATIKNKDEVLSLWAARTPQQARSFAVLAGSYHDDAVHAYDRNGNEVWRFKTEVDPSYKVGPRFKGPWFSNPGYDGSKYHNRGVFTMMAGDFWGTGKEELVIGRPVTLEFHELDGTLIKRLPTRWATNTELALLTKRGKAKDPQVVLAGKFDGGTPDVSAVNSKHRNRGDGWFGSGRVLEGATTMCAWGQCGHGDLAVADLDGDGVEEVITTITGHWNELRVWDGGTTKPEWLHSPLWMKYFGPDTGGWQNVKNISNRFMKALEVADLNGDGKKEVIVGLKIGWVHVYDHAGNKVWSRFLEKGVRCLKATPGGLAVGLSDGRLLLLNGGGRTVRTADLGASVEKLTIVNGNGLVAGTRNGTLAAFALR